MARGPETGGPSRAVDPPRRAVEEPAWALGDVAAEYDDHVGAPARARAWQPPAIPSGEVSKELLAFFQAQGISEDTVYALGVTGALRNGKPTIIFPWCLDGQVVHATYRVAGGTWEAEPRTKPSLFGFLDDTTTQTFTKDELACMAFHEAGDAGAVYAEASRVGACLGTYAEAWKGLERAYLAFDLPDTIVQEITRRLGKHRLWVLPPWPEGCATANETLVKHGRGWLTQAIADAEPFPLEGIHTLRRGLLVELRRRPADPVMHTGIGALDEVVHFPTEGRLVVITGIPSHGKSALLTDIAIRTIQKHGRRWAIFSPENEPWQSYAAYCAQVLTGKRFRGSNAFPSAQVMSDDDIENATAYLRTKMVLISHDSLDQPPDLSWFLEKAGEACARHGITDVAIDPWTELAPSSDNENTARALQRDLQRLTAFGSRHNCNTWVCAHPTKLVPSKPGAKVPVPTAYDINGGAQWYNKASIILSVYRNNDPSLGDISEVHTQKIRFQPRLGRSNAVAKLRFSQETGRYRSADNELPAPKGPKDV